MAYGIKRLPMDAQKREEASLQRMKDEGYCPSNGLRYFTNVWTYNCQMANVERIRDWGHEFKDSYALFQGTQRTYDVSTGERSLQQWRTDTHEIYEARAPKNKQGHRPEGVLVMAPRGVAPIMQKVLVPRDKELEGRAMAVWFARDLYDICACLLCIAP